MELMHHIFSKVDKTQKFIFSANGKTLEISYIDKNDGKDIICVPTQCGCSQGCLFCHMTGSGIPVENLTVQEIYTAVMIVREKLQLSEKPLLVSYMGCGEPLCNVENLIASMALLKEAIGNVRFGLATMMPRGCEEDFIHLGKMVKKLGLNLKVHLSLHFVDGVLRSKWLPSTGGITASLSLLRWYRSYTNNKVEIHYTPIKGVNDSMSDAIILKSMAKEILIKLLEFNPKPGLKSIPTDNMNGLIYWLTEGTGCNIEVYTPPGRDIGASCGQFDLEAYREHTFSED